MIRYILLAGFLLLTLIVRSQAPVANFTSTAASGCATLIVDFKDASTGDPKFWNWDMGNGQLSNQQNPQIAYYYPGTYTVTLVVRNANGTNGITKTNYITVNPSPRAEFSADLNTVCLPGGVQFTDQSVPNAGTLNKWEWDFGDGTYSLQQNPRKNYAATGYYNVSLRVTSTTGCTHLVSKTRFVRVLAGVSAAFKDPVTLVCKPPYDLNFLNETSGPGNLSYKWDFGNGNTSTVKDPTINVSVPTPLNVQLIASSDLGCADTISKPIRINSGLTSFSSADSVCLNATVPFQNTSTLTPVTSRWTFSDGLFPSQNTNTSRTFTTAGTYNVKLVNTYAECTDSLTKSIKVLAAPVVDFTSNVPGNCKAPQVVNFSDISPNAASWQWNFGDGSTSTQKNPSHSYSSAGEYDVTLTITTTTGCQNTLIKPKFIRVVPPVVQISNAPAAGCIPFAFSPVANINSVDGVSSYLWDFGDSGATSTLPNPTHTYTSAGNFTVKLSITTNGGCTSTVTVTDGVKTGLASVAAFSANTSQACADSVVSLTNLSTPAGLGYTWDFGDGKSSTLLNPTHRYDTPGVYKVILTTSNNGCLNVSPATNITVDPPLARFTFKSNCTTAPTVTFTNTSVVDKTKPVAYLWNFGDPDNGTSTLENPVYQFKSKANYNVRLTVTNGSCINTLTFPVSLLTEKADFSMSPSDTVCLLQNITFNAVNSNPQNVKSYDWSFDNRPFVAAPASNTQYFNHYGTVPVGLAVTDLGGCADTLYKNVTIIGSKADFSPSDTVFCESGLITFTDKATPAGTVKTWDFDYGDGSKQSYSAGPFTHQYKTPGSYSVKLSVTAKNGCVDAITYNNLIRIVKPVAAFATNDTLICPGSTVSFVDFSTITRPLSYLWNFGDGTTSTQQNPFHTYSGLDSAYTVSLKIQDAIGCSDSLVRTRYVRTIAPKSAFTISDSATICPPLQVEFTSQAKNFKSFYFDFGDNSNISTSDTAFHFYNDYGRYVAKLYVTGAGGCIDSSEHIININDPGTSAITYSPIAACNSLLVNFTIKKPANSFYIFSYGDGVTDTSQKDSLQHFFSSPNTYTPSMELGDSSGCRVYIGGSNPIKILGAEPFFSADKKTFCDSGTVYFTNYTLTNDPITSSVWDFGDGNTSTDKDAVHSFTQPGQYIVSLNVTTQAGCTKSITDTIRVYKTPVPSITADSVVCINTPLSFTATLTAPDSTIKYTWNLGNGTSSGAASPVVTYTKDGAYNITLEASNILGCKGNASKAITVAPLPVITVAPELTVAVGAGITIPVTYSPKIKTYTWTPGSGLSCSDCALPVASPKITTTYTISVADSNGCKNASSVILTVVCNEKNYFVPNTFSPNGDGANDVFFPRGNNIARVQSMRIFSRWGEMIFEKRNFSANNATDGWNGTFKGKPAPTDAYVYIVEFICENGSIIPFRGNVTLIR